MSGVHVAKTHGRHKRGKVAWQPRDMKQDPALRSATLAPVALFIDGENLSFTTAPEIVAVADTLGQRGIRRVYGDATRMTGWRAQGTLQVVDSAQGKNAAEILLSIEAMEAALLRGVRVIAIASRDRDFSHLARKLAEHGVRVIGIGPADEDCSFRKSCSDYRVIGMSGPADGVAVVKPAVSVEQRADKVDPARLRKWVETVICQSPAKSLTIMALGNEMKERHGVTKKQLPAATWKAYLLSEPRFDVDAGQIVRLRKNKPPADGGLSLS